MRKKKQKWQYLHFDQNYTQSFQNCYLFFLCLLSKNDFGFLLLMKTILQMFIDQHASFCLTNVLFDWLCCQCNSNWYLELLFLFVLYLHAINSIVNNFRCHQPIDIDETFFDKDNTEATIILVNDDMYAQMHRC